MDKRFLETFLENIENGKDELTEAVTPRDLSDLSEIVERMGTENFFLALVNMFGREESPVQDREAVIDYLKEILKLQNENR